MGPMKCRDVIGRSHINSQGWRQQGAALFVCVYPRSALFLMEPQIVKRRKRKMTEAQAHLSGGAFGVQKRQRENEYSELTVVSVTNVRLKCWKE